MQPKDDPRDRRRYPRLKAPVYCRPTRLSLFESKQRAIDISLGGVRIFSDDDVKIGQKLEVELFLPDASSISCKVEVVWVDTLENGSPAKFDVGLKFTEITADAQQKLNFVIEAEHEE